MEEERINWLLPITGILILVVGLSFITWILIYGEPARREKEVEGLSAARNSLRYLRDIENMMGDPSSNPADFDKKWRWAWQEADKVKQASFDQEVTDNLYCSLAGYGAYIVSSTGRAEGADCLRKAEGILRTRYGK